MKFYAIIMNSRTNLLRLETSTNCTDCQVIYSLNGKGHKLMANNQRYCSIAITISEY